VNLARIEGRRAGRQYAGRRFPTLDAAAERPGDIAVNVDPVSAALTRQAARQLLEETDRATALERERILFRWAGQQDDTRDGAGAFPERRPAS
jgi:hypothetical protein